MTRKLQNPTLEDGKSRKRVLKPVVEKKRRDRINQSLAELRRLLLNHTSDPRLQNPKIEKAEILDLAVEHLQRWTDGKNLSDVAANSRMKTGSPAESNAPSLFVMESAGFQQCVAQLTSYMHKITPAQRTNLIEGLKHHTESQQQPHKPRRGKTSLLSCCCFHLTPHFSHTPAPHHATTTCPPLPPPGFLLLSPHTPPLLLSSPSPPACHLCPPAPPSLASRPHSLTLALLPSTAPLSPRLDPPHIPHRGRGHHQTLLRPCGGLGFEEGDQRLNN